MRLTSYDENGPLVPLGAVSYAARADNLPGGKHVFEFPTFMVASDESQVIVEYNDVRLCDFGTRNDYYGFGTSPRTALSDAKGTIEKLEGINADIVVRSTIITRPCIVSDDDPFYYGAQRVHYIPHSWSHTREDIQETKEVFTIWRNGYLAEDAGAYYDRIKELALADAAPARNGEFRSIITGKAPFTRDNFLTHQE